MSNPVEVEACAMAQQLRKGFGQGPIHDVIGFLEERLDIDIAIVRSSDGEHGLTVRDEATGSTYVAVQATAHPMRWRSNLAHEAGHVVFADWGTVLSEEPSARTLSEIRADTFARHLLLPELAFNGDGPLAAVGRSDSGVDLQDLSDIVRNYKVSPIIAGIVLKNVGLIDERKFEEFRTYTSRRLAFQFGWLAEYETLSAATRKTRPPRRLLARAMKGYQLGILSLEQLAQLHDESVGVIQEQLANAEITTGDEG